MPPSQRYLTGGLEPTLSVADAELSRHELFEPPRRPQAVGRELVPEDHVKQEQATTTTTKSPRVLENLARFRGPVYMSDPPTCGVGVADRGVGRSGK